jgi:hypothetical protein
MADHLLGGSFPLELEEILLFTGIGGWEEL